MQRRGASRRSPAERDARLMGRALALAARGLGETNPNPAVGCLVARGDRVLGEGWHARAGGPPRGGGRAPAGGRAGPWRDALRHARALRPLRPHAPRAPLVRDAGVARVVVASADPNPLVRGRGVALLRRAGIVVETGMLAADAARLNERFLLCARRGRPFVLLKAATTLDGRIATASGHSKWITGPAERRQARWLRRLHDAVLVGIGTALADDPLLLPVPRLHRPFARVVLDTRLRLPLESRLARTASARQPVLLLTCSDDPERRRTLEAAGVAVVRVAAARGRVALPAALQALHERGITSVMVEGGSEVLGAFLAARLLDQVALFRAPILLGGRGSRPAFGGADPQEIGDGLRLEPVPSLPAFPWPWTPRFELWRPKL